LKGCTLPKVGARAAARCPLLKEKKQKQVWIVFETRFRAAVFWCHAVVLILDPQAATPGILEAAELKGCTLPKVGARTAARCPLLKEKKQKQVWIVFETRFRAAVFWWHAVVLLLDPHVAASGILEVT
jgi:hypothetical protein